MSTLTIKLSAEDEETILRRMARAGETNRSRHVMNGYLNNVSDGNNAIQEVVSDLDELANAVTRTNELLEQLIYMRRDRIEIMLLASVFLMLHQSVTPTIRAKIDQYINADAAEVFLKDRGVV